MARARAATRECDERNSLLEEANVDQRDLIARRDEERAAWLEEKAALLSSTADLRSSVDEMATALEAVAVYQDEAERRLAQAEEVRRLLGPLIAAGQLTLGVRDGHAVVDLNTDTLFGGSARQMSKRGRATVESLGRALSTIRGLQLEIVGHTDDTPPEEGEEAVDKLELTTVRAVTMAHVLAEAGFPLNRLVASGHADHRPTGAADRGNRRMEVRLVPDYGYLPGAPELEALLTPRPTKATASEPPTE
ncbi:MAG: flagellar motor protein MotB [Myxococcota bacterium]|jgi:flagellar motor protein MotB